MAKTNFDVTKVPLKGANLIEASAGTGKTYSIAILVIRLIIEERIKVKEILMVTFTKAAVAELEVRIRKFIREAYAYVSQNAAIDGTIKTIVDNGIAQIGEDEVLALLNSARKQLDETAIYTIHGFCQKTLQEFAFETGQAFNSDVVEDEAAFINEATSDYWRQKVTTLDTNLLTILLESGLNKNELTEVLTKAKGGKQFIYNTDVDLRNEQVELEKLREPLMDAQSNFNDLYREAIDNLGELIATTKVPKYITDNIRNKNKFRKQLDKAFAKKNFGDLCDCSDRLNEIDDKILERASSCINYIYGEAISYCQQIVQAKKQAQSLFSFDDLINKLYHSISSEALNTAIRKQYKAVFIDEFQDTDQKQYEIFNTFFNGHSILFYIGDPKQSIYSFKGTDIDTYLDAAEAVGSSYTMSNNFRSTANYIDAMNKLFTSIDNPFYDSRIAYEPVGAGFSLSEITNNQQAVDALSIYKCAKLSEVTAQTVNQVKELLMGDYQIDGRKVQPSDIGILVRANSKGKEIKDCLNNANIPAITIDDSRVLGSEQATLIIYLLKAMFEPNNFTINRVLLSYLTNKTKTDLLSFAIEVDLEFFKTLHKIWLEKGVFSAINAFMDKYNTLDTIQTINTTDAERITSNVLQINEILHNKENQSKSSPKDLIHWLESAAEGSEESGEYTQRLENDEDAVKIVTIHKSKGLAYNIVIAPYLDLNSAHNPNWSFIEYKDPEKNQYVFSSKVSDEAENLYAEQAERENRRLIYVALTRAVYMGIVIHNTYRTKPNVGIKAFIDGAIAKQQFNFKDNLEIDTRRYKDTKTDIDKTPKNASAAPINSKWSNYSFSMLSQYEPHLMPEAVEMTDTYDQFIFEAFPKGAMAGNFMHYLFENIDFVASDFKRGIERALNRYKSVFPSENDTLDLSITAMLDHVLNATIPAAAPFCLSQLKQECKLPEMGFDFKMQGFSTDKLQKLIPHISLAREGEIQGMMTGFIDLLFEHEGQFYILDWKSNYIGNTLEDYAHQKLEAAMQESNYHLQYFIYTVATKLYLQNCIPNFDYNTQFGGVIYVYARGCRKGSDTGIYYTKPKLELIEALEGVLVG